MATLHHEPPSEFLVIWKAVKEIFLACSPTAQVERLWLLQFAPIRETQKVSSGGRSSENAK
jgi:hypothetical protein